MTETGPLQGPVATQITQITQLTPTAQLLGAVTRAAALVYHDADPNELFRSLLDDLLILSGSEYGYIGEVLFDDGAPYLQTRAITDISWDENTRNLYEEHVVRGEGLQFRNLDTLFGWGLLEGGRVVIANDLANDPRSSGRPGGHPPLNAYLGLPILRGSQLVGQIAVSNRKGGYDDGIVAFLEPFTVAVGNLIDGYRAHRERRSAETERARSESRLAAITSHLTDIITLLGPDGSWISSSPGGSRLLGYPPGIDPPMGVFSLLHPDDVEPAGLALQEIIEGRRGPEEPVDLRVQVLDGSYRILETMGDNLLDDPVIAAILLTSRDVTARRHAERVLRERNGEMDALLGSLQNGVLFVDDDLRIVFANEVFCEMFRYGCSPAELVGMSSTDIRDHAVQMVLDGGGFRRGVESAYVGKVRRVGDLLRMTDGRTLERDYTPVIRERREESRMKGTELKNAHLWIYRDVTQRSLLDEQRQTILEREQALRRSTQEQNRSLLEIDELKSQFVATVSHELRTPLASIVGFAELLLDDRSGFRPDQQEFLEIVFRNSQRLLELVEDLLLISRLESGAHGIDPRPTVLAELVCGVVDTFRPEAASKRVDVAVELSGAPGSAMIDRSRFDQVIRNLVSNALKFTDEGGRITVSTERLAGSWVIRVADTGIGIPAEDIDRLFDRFFRGSNTRLRQYPGSGLGLAIARGIVELHGGSIGVAANEGGTVFTVELPDRESASGPLPPAPARVP